MAAKRRNVAVWDERRNTSRVFQVPPNAIHEAWDALTRWSAANPAHARWIADGAPTLTQAEHVARFGGEYAKPKSGRGRRGSG